MSTITLKDGTFIHNEASLLDYLSSLGFDKLDIESLREMLCEKQIEKAYDEGLRDQYNEDEREIDGYFCAARDLAQGIEDLCDDFYRQYKSKAVLNVLDTFRKFVDENRID